MLHTTMSLIIIWATCRQHLDDSIIKWRRIEYRKQKGSVNLEYDMKAIQYSSGFT